MSPEEVDSCGYARTRRANEKRWKIKKWHLEKFP